MPDRRQPPGGGFRNIVESGNAEHFPQIPAGVGRRLDQTERDKVKAEEHSAEPAVYEMLNQIRSLRETKSNHSKIMEAHKSIWFQLNVYFEMEC